MELRILSILVRDGGIELLLKEVRLQNNDYQDNAEKHHALDIEHVKVDGGLT